MTTSVEVTRECPSCRQMLTFGETSCPQCGKEITNDPKKAGKAKRTPAKVAKIECPYCGELVSKRSKKCPACRTSLPPGFYKVSAKSIDEETSEPKTSLIEQVIQVAGDETNKSPGSNSSVVLEGSEPECQESEALIEGGLKAVGTTVFVDSPSVRGPPETVEDQNQTAELAVPVESKPVKEPDVKIEDQGGAAETVILVEPTPVGESSGIVAGEMGIAEPIVPANTIVPVEDAPRTVGDEMKQFEVTPRVDSLPAEKPSETIENDRKTAETVAHVDSAPAEESPKTASFAEVGDSMSSHVCEAIVLRSSLEIPSWIAGLIEMAPHVEQVQPAAEPSKAQPLERSNAPIAETGNKPVRLVRKRKLKSAQLTTIPVVAPDG